MTPQMILDRNFRLAIDYMSGFEAAMIAGFDSFWQNFPVGVATPMGNYGVLTRTDEVTINFQPYDKTGVYTTALNFGFQQPMAQVTLAIPMIGQYLAQTFNVALPVTSGGYYPYLYNADGTPNNFTGTLAEWQAAPKQAWLAVYGEASVNRSVTEAFPATV